MGNAIYMINWVSASIVWRKQCMYESLLLFKLTQSIIFHMHRSHCFVYMNHDNYSHEISVAFFLHTFLPRNSAKAKINEVGHEQNIRKQYNLLEKQYNLLWLLQIPFTLTLRLWDIFILEGEKILTGMAYNIIKLHRSKWKYDQACLLSLWNFLIQQWTCSLDEKLIFANVQMSDIIWLWSICWDLICSF